MEQEISIEDISTSFLNKIADIKPSDIPNDDGMVYYSKYDGSYLTRVGMEEECKFLIKYGISEKIGNKGTGKVANIGFNPSEQKWYGWSHRAIFGFGVGSTCKKGDCHYQAANEKDFIEGCIDFFREDYKLNMKGVTARNEDGALGVKITWKYSNKVPNEKLRGTIGSTFSYYPDNFGRGEWTAKTLDDAKQMAIDFASGVS